MPSLVDAEGNLVQVDDAAEADAMLQQGTHGLRADAPVAMFSPDGELGDVDPGDMGSMLAAGYRLAGDSEVAAYEEQQQFGEQDLRTFGEAAARGATFGLSDYAFEQLGVDKRDLEARQRVNDTASTLGEVTGVVGATLLTSGLGAASGAARGAGIASRIAAATPAGLAARAGTAASRVVQGTEATTALSRVAQAARVAGAAGAVEGGLYGAAKAVNDDWLVDHEITAERIAMGGFLGAATGGLSGAATGAALRGAVELAGTAQQKIGNLLGKAMREDADRAAAGLVPAPRQSVDEALDAALPPDQAAEAMGPIDLGAIASEQTGVSRLLEGARAAEGGLRKTQQSAIEGIVKKGKRLFALSSRVDDQAGLAAKRAFADRYNGWGVPVQDVEAASVARAVGDDMTALIDEMGTFLGTGGGTVKRVTKMAREAEQRVSAHLSKGNLGDAFMELDSFKRALGKAQNVRSPEASQAIRAQYERVREFLEKPEIWGELAEMQRAINPSWAESIRRKNSSFVRRFFAKGGEAADDPFEVLTEVNGEAVGAFLNRVDDEAAQQANDGLRRYLRSLAVDAKNRARVLGDEGLAASAGEIEALVRGIEGDIDGVALAANAAEEWRGKVDFLGAVPGLPTAVGAATKGLGKLAGAAEGLAARLSSLPQRADGPAADAYRSAAKAERKTIDAAEGLLANAARSTARIARTASKVAPSTAGEVGSVLGVKLSAKDPAAYEKAIERVAEMRDPDSPLRSEMRFRAMEAAIESPELAQQMEAQIQRTADFLAARAGPSGKAVHGDVFGHLKPAKHAPAKAMKLARYADAAEDPLAALDRLKRGDVRDEDVETLREMYPRLYQRFAQRLMTEAAKVKSRPNAASEIALRKVLGNGPVTAVRTGLMQELAQSQVGADAQRQDDAMAQPAVTPGNAQPPDLAEAIGTRSDRLMGGL